MDDAAKLMRIKAFLGISDTSEDTTLTAYLQSAKDEILAWVYSYTADYRSAAPTITDVPKQYEQVQIMAVVAGFTQRGAEGEETHNENGTNRKFVFDDMVSYIHAKCIPCAGVM